MRKHTLMVWVLSACLAGMGAAGAQSSAFSINDGIDARLLADMHFLDAHPDLRWRNAGLSARERGRMQQAFEYFVRAASYADKPSQAMIAEMLWKGEGASPDRPRAYAWMDLAAERGYPGFVVVREQYWQQLSESERARALTAGEAIYAEYADKITQPRMERELIQARRSVTGSKLGTVGSVKRRGSHFDPHQIPELIYYDPKWWEPKLYWAWQAQVWNAAEVRKSSGSEDTPAR